MTKATKNTRLVILKSLSETFITTYVSFVACFEDNMITNVVRTTVKVIRLNSMFSFSVEKSKCFSSFNMFV